MFPTRLRQGFLEPATAAVVALLIVGAVSLATTSRALDVAVATDTRTNAATEVTAPPPVLLPAPPVPPVPIPTPVSPPVPPAPVPAPVPVPSPAAVAVPGTEGRAVPIPPLAPLPSPGSPPPLPAGTPEAGIAPADVHPEPPLNPNECSDARRQIREQFRELNRFEKLLRKQGLTADLDRLITLRSKLKEHDRQFQKGCTRDVLQEYWDEQVWEDINTFRCKAEFPQQFTQMERDYKRLDRQVAAKRLDLAGLNPDAFRGHVAKGKQALVDAKAALAAGSCEDAQEAMQAFWEEGLHPGEVMGVVGRLSDLGRQVRRIRDANVRKEFQDVIQPIIDVANDGDFREANGVLNDVFHTLQQLLAKVVQSLRYQYSPQLEKLETLLQQKLGSEGEDVVPGPQAGGGTAAGIPRVP